MIFLCSPTKFFFQEEKDAILLALDAGAHYLIELKKSLHAVSPFFGRKFYTTETVYKEKIDIALQRIIRQKLKQVYLDFLERRILVRRFVCLREIHLRA